MTTEAWKIAQPEAARFPSYRIVSPSGATIALVPIMAHGHSAKSAELIAAVPEMLVALKAVEWNGSRSRCPECLAPRVVGKHEKHCRLANAIAKAEGRT